MSDQTDFEMVSSKLGSFTREELIELRTMIDDLISSFDEITEAAQNMQGKSKVIRTRGGGGSIELKMIRGYGPYAYWRFWLGKRHCSRYLGKWAAR